MKSFDATTQATGSKIQMTVLIPALQEGPNLAILLPRLTRTLDELLLTYELIVITKDGDHETIEAAARGGARVLLQTSQGYGGALVDGLRQAGGDYILTLDADLSHRPDFVKDMWNVRDAADITIASRYVPGGTATMPGWRLYLSRVLNVVFQRGLSMPVRDLSSGFRLYRRSTLDPERLQGTDFDVLEEILVRAFCEGWRVQEVPFNYMPREHGSSSARLGRLGRAYVRSFWRLWKLRNSIAAADYDDRAYDSSIPVQRYWQRSRFRILRDLMEGEGPVLDVGCGSSRIISCLPKGSVALDILRRKLRFDRRFGVALVQGSGFSLPFPDNAFSCVVSSEVINRVPKDSPLLSELCRVLRPGGRLILGTPDYARREWVYLEKVYARVVQGGYANVQVAHYTRGELIEILAKEGLGHEETRYIARSELIMAFRRPIVPTPVPGGHF